MATALNLNSGVRLMFNLFTKLVLPSVKVLDQFTDEELREECDYQARIARSARHSNIRYFGFVISIVLERVRRLEKRLD